MQLFPRRSTASRGYTLLELAITLGIVGVVLSSVTGVFDSSRATYGQGSAMARVQTEARRALDRVSMELENAGWGTLLPNPVGIAANDMVFQVAGVVLDPSTGQMVTDTALATGTIVFGTSARLRFVYEQGELNNGLDDDGDGTVDEGCIELTKNYLLANEQPVILAHGVTELLEGEIAGGGDENGNGLLDERGFCMTRVGNLLRVRITLARPVVGRDPAITTVETAIRLKN